MNAPTAPVLICTGFHRSATSVTAQWLSRAGLPLWLWGMGAQASNPQGHFEDWAAVGLHDALLARQGLDWQFAGEAAWFPEAGIESLERYVSRRDAHAKGGTWGIKDPRTCLFLPAWHEALGERGRYLFVLRHWASCMDSLLRRHSSALAMSPTPGRQHLTFWEQPTLAARMWLAYNRSEVAFARAHSDRVLPVTQKKVFDKFDLPGVARERLGVPLRPVESPVRPALLSESVDARVADLIPPELQAELNDCWQELLEICEHKAESEAVSWQEPGARPLPGWANGLVNKRVSWANQSKPAPPDDLAGRLESVLASGDKSADVSAIFDAIERQAPFDARLWETLARMALRNARWGLAERAIERVLSFGETRPYHSMMLGDARFGAGDERAAEVLYHQARWRNPKNVQFHLRLARMRMLQGRQAKAEQVLLEGLTNFDEPPESLLVMWCECLDQQGRRIEAIEWLSARDALSDELADKVAAMEMAEGLAAGEQRQRHLESKRISGLDKPLTLENALSGVTERAAREDLAWRMCRVWEETSN